MWRFSFVEYCLDLCKWHKPFQTRLFEKNMNYLFVSLWVILTDYLLLVFLIENNNVQYVRSNVVSPIDLSRFRVTKRHQNCIGGCTLECNIWFRLRHIRVKHFTIWNSVLVLKFTCVSTLDQPFHSNVYQPKLYVTL